MTRLVAIFAVVSMASVPLIATNTVRVPARSPSKPPVAALKRTPSNVKGACSERGCACDDLGKQIAACSAVISPADGAPRNHKSMRDCYLSLVSKRRVAMSTRASCGAVDRSSAQIEDLRASLARSESNPKDQHVSSSKSLEGFGMDLVGHLDGSHRTPASGN